MTYDLNFTHDPNIRSWVQSSNDEDSAFPIQNLPFGVFKYGARVACGVAIGNSIVDVGACFDKFDGRARVAASACNSTNLNGLMNLGNGAASELRRQLFNLLREGNEEGRRQLQPYLLAQNDCRLLLPVRIGGYTDFYACLNHAANVGSIFRPEAPLLPNYKHIPIAYNGRANSVQVSDTPVRRPAGQSKARSGDTPTFGPSARLDYEVELGLYIGKPSARYAPIALREAEDHFFGISLLNDWSARDIQFWEYQPLGPFLSKSFATSVSPWVVTREALAPFRQAAPERPAGDPTPLPYLVDEQDASSGGLNVTVDTFVSTSSMRSSGVGPRKISSSNSSALYWTFAQMLTHFTSNGSSLDTGDLIGSGTLSGTAPGSLGCLLEITRGGASPLALADGETRTWLEDGDEISMHGYCEKNGFRRIGLGSCTATILPAKADY
ncbi:fumarylacetoacetase [Paraburkholderia youngii]|uniref:fumarylacetoacetase n=1 Tax=Paraburkholderia youngii TaxID=2782701 RepID=UPI003D26377A